MDSTIIIALISFAGTLLGTFGGIITSNKLTNYRIEQLEKKVDKHNGFGEKIPVMETRIEGLEHRVEELEHRN